MYARSTTVRGNPQAMDDGIAYIRDKVMPAVRQMDGCVGLSMLAERDTGRCIVTTSWADHESLKASADGVMAMRRASRGDHGRPGRGAGVGGRAHAPAAHRPPRRLRPRDLDRGRPRATSTG